MENKNMSNKIMYLVTTYSIILNVALAITKYFLGKYSGSTALTADAVHSGLDVISSFIVLSGIYLSSRKVKNYPYGLYKIENFTSAFVSILIILTAFEIGKSIFENSKALNSPLESKLITIAILCLITFIIFLYSRFERNIGIKYSAPGIIADSEHIKSDMLSLLVLMINILLNIFKINIDKYITLAIVVLVAYSGWKLLKESIMVLLDVSIDYSTVEEIRNIIMSFPQVSEITKIKGRKAGRYIFIEIDVKFDIVTLEEAHKLSNMIEEEIYDNLPNIDSITLHYEPYKKQEIKIAIPLQKPEIKEISKKFGESPYFAFITYDLKDKKISAQEICNNEKINSPEKRGINVALWILEDKKADIIVASPDIINSAPYFVFKANNKKIYTTENVDIVNINDFVDSAVASI